jgi:hypothetical protein
MFGNDEIATGRNRHLKDVNSAHLMTVKTVVTTVHIFLSMTEMVMWWEFQLGWLVMVGVKENTCLCHGDNHSVGSLLCDEYCGSWSGW